MIKNKNKNKLARKIILSTLSFPSLVGVGLSALFTNGVNLKEEKLVNNQEISKIEEKNIGTTRPAPPIVNQTTTIVKKEADSFYNLRYPFELPIPTVGTSIAAGDPFWNFFEIKNGFPLDDTTTKFELKTINLANRAKGLQGGIYSFSGTLSKSKDSTGATVTIPVPLVVRVTGMRSVTAPTGISIVPLDALDKYKYASDNTGDAGNATRFLKVSNGIYSKVSVNSQTFDTTLDVLTPKITFNNKGGTLTIPAELRNYIDTDDSGKFMPSDSGPKPNTTTNISGFKQIPGPTRFVAKQPAASATNPTTLLKNAASDGSLSVEFQEQYFTLENPLTITSEDKPTIISTKLATNVDTGKTGFVISEPDDTKGTLKVTVTVIGGYYGEENGNLLPMRSNTPETIEQTFSFIVDGFANFVDNSGDNLTLVIAGIGGGVAFIAIVIALIFFIRFQKKKNEQVRKKKSMEDKLYTMSNTPKKGSGIANSAGIAPGGTAPGRAPGGPQAPGKYVPPTISVPKSNAPVVKRPSAPTGPSAGSTPPPMVKK